MTHTGSFIPHSVFDNPDMVIGADFFIAHRVYVAPSRRKVYFTFKGGPISLRRHRAQAVAPAAGSRTRSAQISTMGGTKKHQTPRNA